MRNKLEGTQTEQALINSFAGESQARNRYTYFASIAKKEGYEQISAIFSATADNEKEHAKIFYSYLSRGIKQVSASYPFELGTTRQNLISAAAGEKEEWEILYYNAAKIAQEEGFDDIAESFNAIREAEKHHEYRYLELLKTLEADEVFHKTEEITWMCRNCAYLHYGYAAPQICPACKHPQAYYQVLCEKY